MKTKKLVNIVLLFSIFLVVVPIISAQQQYTDKYQKQFLEPFYRESMEPDTPYNYTLVIEAPDKISNIKSAIISFSVWHNPTIRYTLTVNGQSCKNPSFLVSTSYENAGNNEIFFDCSNVITKAGTYYIILTPDDDTGTITGWADITYTNKPRGEITLHGTEYKYESKFVHIAKPWLQLLDANGTEVDEGICYIDIYSPNGLQYVEKGLMINMQHDGIYYYDLPVPIQDGVYPVIAECYFIANQTPITSSSYSIYAGEYKQGDITDTYLDDSAFLEVKTFDNVNTTMQIDMNFTFDSFYSNCSGINESLFSSLGFYWEGTWETDNINHDIYVNFWNYTSGEYVQGPNEISGGNGGTRFSITNSLEGNNITKMLGITPTQPLIVKINDTLNLESQKKFRINYMYATCDQLADPDWQQVKGSSELHVTSEHPWEIEITSGEIRNDTFPGHFYYNFTIESGVGQDTNDITTYVILPKPFSCHHINNLTINGTVYNLTNLTLSNADNDAKSKGCKVEWDMDMEVGKNYLATIDADNWFKELEILWLTEMQLQRSGVWTICQNYRLENNLSEYVLPRPNTEYPLKLLNDSLYDICYAYLDVYYHYNETYYNEYYTPQGVFTYADMLYFDNLYVHMLEGRDELNIIAQTLLNVLSTTADYSWAIKNNNLSELEIPTWAENYSNISTSYINYLTIARVPESTWNYTNRTLTDYSQSGLASIIWSYTNRSLTNYSETSIANVVWAYSGTIGANLVSELGQAVWEYSGTPTMTLLNNITANVWSYTGVPTTSLLNNISSNVWNFVTRNLTWYNMTDTTNYTKINSEVPKLVWTYENRTITDGNVTIEGNVTIDPTQIWNYSGDINSNITGQFVNDTWNYTARYTHGEIV